MVLHAAGPGQAAALNELCRLYWRPLYSFCRGAGHAAADAEDLTQGYFAQLLARGALGLADPDRGKFRTFLLTSFRNYQTAVHRQRTAAKRGGTAVHVPFEMDATDGSLVAVSPDAGPETAFDRQWAWDLVRRAEELLATEQASAGRSEWFQRVLVDECQDYASLAKELRTTVAALKSYAQRVRHRFRVLVERQVADTVTSPGEMATEMTYLSSLIRNAG
jgi:RNA polymerase sigma-70 factor (ECF subfamily)